MAAFFGLPTSCSTLAAFDISSQYHCLSHSNAYAIHFWPSKRPHISRCHSRDPTTGHRINHCCNDSNHRTNHSHQCRHRPTNAATATHTLSTPSGDSQAAPCTTSHKNTTSSCNHWPFPSWPKSQQTASPSPQPPHT